MCWAHTWFIVHWYDKWYNDIKYSKKIIISKWYWYSTNCQFYISLFVCVCVCVWIFLYFSIVTHYWWQFFWKSANCRTLKHCPKTENSVPTWWHFWKFKKNCQKMANFCSRKQGVSDTIFPFYFLLLPWCKNSTQKKSLMNDNH